VAQEIGKTIRELGATADILNLKETKVQPAGYDLIIIGSGIQAGKWTREPLEFITRNRDALADTKVALFVVCASAGSPDQCDTAQTKYLDKIVSSYPYLHIVSTGLFGGVFDFKKYSAPVRMLVKSIVKKQTEDDNLPERIDMRDWDKVRSWARSVMQL